MKGVGARGSVGKRMTAKTSKGGTVRMPGGSPSDPRSYMGTSIPNAPAGFLNRRV